MQSLKSAIRGTSDPRNIRRKLRSDGEHRENSPWNIATKFRVEMDFSVDDIAGMLKEYEADRRTGMDVVQMAGLLYNETSGYPYLVSWLSKYLDEEISGSEGFPDKSSAWTKDGFLAAVKMLLEDDNPLFQSLMEKLNRAGTGVSGGGAGGAVHGPPTLPEMSCRRAIGLQPYR